MWLSGPHRDRRGYGNRAAMGIGGAGRRGFVAREAAREAARSAGGTGGDAMTAAGAA